jgi:hypothetical protein
LRNYFQFSLIRKDFQPTADPEVFVLQPLCGEILTRPKPSPAPTYALLNCYPCVYPLAAEISIMEGFVEGVAGYACEVLKWRWARLVGEKWAPRGPRRGCRNLLEVREDE